MTKKNTYLHYLLNIGIFMRAAGEIRRFHPGIPSPPVFTRKNDALCLCDRGGIKKVYLELLTPKYDPEIKGNCGRMEAVHILTLSYLCFFGFTSIKYCLLAEKRFIC